MHLGGETTMNNLEHFRTLKGISRSALAQAVNVSERHIAFLESGQRNPSLTLAFNIAKQLDHSMEDIFLPIICTNSTYNLNDESKKKPRI